jgi:hypothetical protein
MARVSDLEDGNTAEKPFSDKDLRWIVVESRRAAVILRVA